VFIPAMMSTHASRGCPDPHVDIGSAMTAKPDWWQTAGLSLDPSTKEPCTNTTFLIAEPEPMTLSFYDATSCDGSAGIGRSALIDFGTLGDPGTSSVTVC
jgi:hypothetical protein